MENKEPHSEDTDKKLAVIRDKAADLYGKDTEFAYRLPGDIPMYAMLTLDQAIEICGTFIAEKDGAMLWTTLDKLHKNAETILSKDEQLIAMARALGEKALEDSRNLR